MITALSFGWAGLAMFHRHTVWSQLAVARTGSLAEKATVRTVFASWLKVVISTCWVGSVTLNRVTFWSAVPVPMASMFPLGENAAAATQSGKLIVLARVALRLCEWRSAKSAAGTVKAPSAVSAMPATTTVRRSRDFRGSRLPSPLSEPLSVVPSAVDSWREDAGRARLSSGRDPGATVAGWDSPGNGLPAPGVGRSGTSAEGAGCWSSRWTASTSRRVSWSRRTPKRSVRWIDASVRPPPRS